jgi:CHAT domain-containing protein/Tfp pilus assembly protein PilF
MLTAGASAVSAFIFGSSINDVYISYQKAMNLYQQGRYEEALNEGEKAFTIVEKNPEDMNFVQVLGYHTYPYGLSHMFYMQRDKPKGRELFIRFQILKEKIFKSENPALGQWISTYALIYSNEGKYAEAEKLLFHVLKIYEKEYGADNYNMAFVYGTLANLYAGVEDYEKAERMYNRAIGVSEKAFGRESINTISYMGVFAAMYVQKGDYERALQIYEHLIKFYEKEYGADSIQTANILSSRAQVYVRMGRYKEAEPLMLKALRIKEIYDPAEDYKKTLEKQYKDIPEKQRGPLIQQAMTSYQKFSGVMKKFAVFGEMTNLGWLYNESGQYQKAEDIFKRALEIPKTITEKGFIEASFVPALSGIATTYHKTGRFKEAELFYKEVLEKMKNYVGEESVYYTLYLDNLALMYGSAGESEKALQVFKQAYLLDGKLLQNIFFMSSERQKLGIVQKRSNSFYGALAMIRRSFAGDRQSLRFAMNLMLQRKGIVFDVQARQQEAIANSLDRESRELWSELARLRVELAGLQQREPAKEAEISATGVIEPGKTMAQGGVGMFSGKPEKASPEEIRSRIESLKEKIDRLEAELSSKNTIVAEELSKQKPAVEGVAKRLPADSVFVEFVKLKNYNWEKSKWDNTYNYIAFILYPDERIKMIDIGDADRLENKVSSALSQLRAEIGVRGALIIPAAKPSDIQKNLFADLHRILWKPLSDSIGNAKRVLISPDGILNVVPFCAIIDDKGKFLIENFTISYLTSGRDFLRGKAGIKPETDLFLAADPAFDISVKAEKPEQADFSAGLFRSSELAMKFERLPGTAEEARIIPAMLPGERKEIVTGEKATESAVLSAKTPRVLHLATHGFFMKDQKWTAPGDVHSFTGEMKLSFRGYENPLVRSGLAFAGANSAEKAPTSNDGLLTALEVSGMSLHGTDLVTLSACETGVGEVITGEGVFGLRRAFALSGARNLLMSLWPVSDVITAEQMMTFYRLYGQGKSPADALRQAQLETISKLKEKSGYALPSLWAPFIIQGPPD